MLISTKKNQYTKNIKRSFSLYVIAPELIRPATLNSLRDALRRGSRPLSTI